MSIEFRRQVVESRVLNPFSGFDLETIPVEIRWDPLLGHSARIIQRSLRPSSQPDLSRVIERTSNCHFCAAKLETNTPRIIPEISPEPRLRSGTAVLFPNIAAYAKYSGVSIFSTDHFVTLAELQPAIIADVLRVNLHYAKLVFDYDREAAFCTVCANYLPSAGGSMVHPHVQVSCDATPTTITRLALAASLSYWQEMGTSYWHDLVAHERQRGERYIGTVGCANWLAAFAPMGFDEVQAVLPGRSTLLELSDTDVQDIAIGLSRVLRYYHDSNHNSYNLAIYSAPFGSPAQHFSLHLRVISRSNYEAYYRSDATYWERLHGEALVSTKPEETAVALRRYFQE